MDTYTLMCSKMEELQREWEPKEGDRYHYWMSKESEGTGFLDRKDIEDTDNPGMLAYDLDWLPTLDQLVGMMPPFHEFSIIHNPLDSKRQPWQAEIHVKDDSVHMIPCFYGESWMIAAIQALAWARWGKEWDEEKGEWRDGK